MSSDSETEVELNNLEDNAILNKYKMAAEIVQKIMKELITKCQPGVNIFDVCTYGDQRITEETTSVFKKEKEMKKGIAYPTCISRNNIVGNFSPEQSTEIFEKDDLVKIDIGAYIDGYAAIIGHTFVLGASKDNKVTGRKADVILAAYNCAEAALRLVKPGRDKKAVTEPICLTAADFNCKLLENCVFYGMEKNVYDNKNTLTINQSEEVKKAEKIEKTEKLTEFEVNQVWTVDVTVTTGDGKVKERETKTTMYKRNLLPIYQLKMKASRQFFSDVCNKSLGYPFTIRSFADLTKAKIGVIECAKHNLVDPLPVMYEKDNEFVARFKFTVLLTANGPMKLTGLPFDSSLYQSTCKIQNSTVKTLLSEPIKNKKKVETN